MMKVEIYGAPWCGYCKQAKKMCEAYDIEHEYYDVDENPKHKVTLEERLQQPVRTIPQIFVDGEHLPKGYESLQQKVLSL